MAGRRKYGDMPKTKPVSNKPAISSDSFAVAEAPPDAGKMEAAKGDLEALLAADDIRNDPEKMKHVKLHAQGQMTRIRSLQDLKDVAEMKAAQKKK